MMDKLKIVALVAAGMLAAGTATAGGNAEAGKGKSAVCAGCHGPEGNSVAPNFPRLAGQFPDYMFHALKAYKSGERKNAIMVGQVAGLSEQDMADLAAYFASQEGLGTINIVHEDGEK